LSEREFQVFPEAAHRLKTAAASRSISRFRSRR
jgi:hypothetical protein